MPYTMQTEGADDLLNMLQQLGEKAPGIAAKALYDGAGKMADEIEKQAGAVHTAPFHYAVFLQRDVSPEELAAIKGKVGIAKFQRDGVNANTSVGYANSGYTTVAGKVKPIPKIANAINSGTSFMKKQPFFRKAVTAGTKTASEAMTKKIEAEIDALTK